MISLCFVGVVGVIFSVSLEQNGSSAFALAKISHSMANLCTIQSL